MNNRAQDPIFATVLVGPKHARFVVHEELLVHHSESFRAALIGNFKEAKDKVVKLEEEDVDIFEIYVHWMYHGRFPASSEGDALGLVALFANRGDEDVQTREQGSNIALVQLYIFADKYIAKSFQRTVLDAFYDCVKDDVYLPSTFAIRLAFEHLNNEDPLCRLLMDSYATGFDAQASWSEYFVKEDCQFTHQFLIGVLQRLSLKIDNLECFASDCSDEYGYCDYHEHKSEEERKACKEEREHNK
jgi:hypothetical protein